MEEKRKQLLDAILAECKKIFAEKSWPVTEEEFIEHSGISTSFDFGFVCGFLCHKEKMMKDTINGVVEEPNPLQWRIVSEDLEGEFVVKNNLIDGTNVKLIIIKEG